MPQPLESYESRLHHYALLTGPAKCAWPGCGADSAIGVSIETPDLMTGSRAYYCALHAEEGTARALAFVMKGRR